MCKNIIFPSERNAVKQSDRKVQMKQIETFLLPSGFSIRRVFPRVGVCFIRNLRVTILVNLLTLDALFC